MTSFPFNLCKYTGTDVNSFLNYFQHFLTDVLVLKQYKGQQLNSLIYMIPRIQCTPSFWGTDYE